VNPVSKTLRIAELNDLARTAMGVASRVIQTPGINALPPPIQSKIRENVETFNNFEKGNDPYGERDFGSFEVEGHKVYWKIDYFDLDYEMGSEEPENAAVTRRVLTIMLAEEY
jgi:hypothetical protein